MYLRVIYNAISYDNIHPQAVFEKQMKSHTFASFRKKSWLILNTLLNAMLINQFHMDS